MLDLYYVSNRMDKPKGIKLFNKDNLGYEVNSCRPYYDQPYIKLTEPPFYFDYEAITDNKYKYSSIDTKNGERITSLYKDIVEETYPLVIKCKTQAAYEDAINKLYRLVDYDIAAKTEGYFVLSDGKQDWFLKGYILGFEKALWQHDMGMAVCNLSIVFEDKLWKRIIWLGSRTHGTRRGTNNASVVFDISQYKLEKPCDFVMYLKPYTLISETPGQREIERLYEGLDDYYGIGFGVRNNIIENSGIYYADANWPWKNYYDVESLAGRMGIFGGIYAGTSSSPISLKHKLPSQNYDFRSIEPTTPGVSINRNTPKEFWACERPWCPYVRFDTKNNTIHLIDVESGLWQSDNGSIDTKAYNCFKSRYNDAGSFQTNSGEYDKSDPRKIIGGTGGLIQITTFLEPRTPDQDGIIPTESAFGREVPHVGSNGDVYASTSSDLKPFEFDLFITDERRCPVWD